jgi:hypothetical protein
LLRCFLPLSLLAFAIAFPQNTPSAPPAPTEGVLHYTAFGGGHLLKEVRENGRFLTLEDGSRWETDPDVRFQTAEWQVEAQITVRHASEQSGYTYELDNTDEDEGALAKYLGQAPPRSYSVQLAETILIDSTFKRGVLIERDDEPPVAPAAEPAAEPAEEPADALSSMPVIATL